LFGSGVHIGGVRVSSGNERKAATDVSDGDLGRALPLVCNEESASYVVVGDLINGAGSHETDLLEAERDHCDVDVQLAGANEPVIVSGSTVGEACHNSFFGGVWCGHESVCGLKCRMHAWHFGLDRRNGSGGSKRVVGMRAATAIVQLAY
jgi:hypothetical protein